MIKRLLVAVLCMAVMFSGTMFVSASTDGYAIIDYVKMELGWKEVDDEYGYPYEIDVTDATFNLTNNCETVTQFAPMVAFYADDMLVDVVKADAKTIAKGASGRFSVKSETAYNEDADSCKVFVLGENLVPYANVGTGIYNETVVSSSGAKLNNIGAGDLRISSNVGDGDVELLDVTIRGNLIVEGGGSESVKIEDCDIFGKIVVNKELGETPRIELTNTPVEKIELKTPATIEVIDDSSAIQELVVTADLEIRGENTQIGKIVIDETAGEKVELKVPATLQTEVEVNSVNGVDFGETDTSNITFSTTNVEKAEEIFNQIKDYTEHMHVWTEQEIALGYNMVECNGCDEGKNRADKVISFTFDEYVDFDYDTGVVEYMPTDGDSVVQTATINIGYNDTDYILYNGVKEESKYPDDYFRPGFIDEYTTCYSGKVTLIDNDGNDDYDVVCIEVPTYGVVDEVGENGRLWFKNDVETLHGEWVRINFKDSEQTIYLTRDGEEIDYTELSEGDVLSILWNPSKEVYYVDVLNNKIEGIINWRAASTTSATGYEYSINGEVYDVVYGAYGCENLKPGAEGTFYIDDYGKIVAYRKFVNENYGYILNSCKMCDDWDNENVKLQMLASDGEVYEATLAERVKIEYPETVGMTAEDLGCRDDYLEQSATYDVEDIDSSALAEAAKNNLIAYELNSIGEITTITFHQYDADVPSLYFERAGEEVRYDSRDALININGRHYDVTEDTLVFFINNATNNVYTDGGITGAGSPAFSATSTREDLDNSIVYDYGMCFNSQNGIAEVVVLYNTSIEVEESEEELTSGNGYILNSCVMSDDWDNETVKLQMLASDGEVYEVTLTEKFTITNPQEAELDANETDIEAVAYAIRNKLIVYEMNTYGEIVTVTFCTGVAGQVEVNDGKTRITVGDNEYSLTEGTIVFFVNNSSSNVYDGDAVTGVGSKACSTVETRDKLVSGATYDCGVVFSSQYGVAEAIVIYNTSVEVGESNEEVTSGYGYILNSCVMCDDWDNENVMLQMLADDGEVYEATFAEQIKIEYPLSAGLTMDELGDDFDAKSATYDIEDINIYALACAIKNQLVTYEMNLYGQIKTITFAQTDEDELSLCLTDTAEDVEFDGEDFVIDFGKKYDVAEDAIVFFIQNASNNVYDGDAVTGNASKTMSKVATAAALSDGENYAYGELYDSQDDIANVIVLYNTTGGISSSSNIAVIDKVGEAVYNGEEAFYIKYYMDGKLCESYTDVNYDGDLYWAEPGDLYKFALSADGTIITESAKYYDYARTADAGPTGALNISGLASLSGKEALQSGLVLEYVSGRKTFRVAADVLCDDNGNDDPEDDVYGIDYVAYDRIKLADGANVYVLDPNKAKNNLSIGEASDVEVDRDVLRHAQGAVDFSNTEELVFEDAAVDVYEAPLGAMDYVVAFSYDDDVIDVVIYKAFDFGRILY